MKKILLILVLFAGSFVSQAQDFLDITVLSSATEKFWLINGEAGFLGECGTPDGLTIGAVVRLLNKADGMVGIGIVRNETYAELDAIPSSAGLTALFNLNGFVLLDKVNARGLTIGSATKNGSVLSF